MNGFQIVAAAAIVAAASLTSVPASAEVRRNERVTITSCPYPGVTGNCLMIKGANGTVYNITAISPRPREHGRMIRVRGTITDKMSVCGEGIVLERIRWTRTRQLCPN
jgi:hypothetical protein